MAQIPDPVFASFKTGNAIELSAYFNSEIELVILNQENIYSKAQAQIILSDFFKQNKPKDFIVIHQGDKGNMHYVIGSLITNNNKTYRTYFLIKNNKNNSKINLLRIENE